MVEEGASESFDEISIGGRDLINREDLLKRIKSNFEGLSLKNIKIIPRDYFTSTRRNVRDSRRKFLFRK